MKRLEKIIFVADISHIFRAEQLRIAKWTEDDTHFMPIVSDDILNHPDLKDYTYHLDFDVDTNTWSFNVYRIIPFIPTDTKVYVVKEINEWNDKDVVTTTLFSNLSDARQLYDRLTRYNIGKYLLSFDNDKYVEIDSDSIIDDRCPQCGYSICICDVDTNDVEFATFIDNE